ncbi:MAG: hypothetical protein ACRYG5_04125 [Janthinobacterium lividum]
MHTLLSLIAAISALLIFGYLVVSFQSAIWVSKRHGEYFHLEFAPQRARGNREPKRVKLLRRMRLWAIAAVPICLAALIFRAVTM